MFGHAASTQYTHNYKLHCNCTLIIFRTQQSPGGSRLSSRNWRSLLHLASSRRTTRNKKKHNSISTESCNAPMTDSAATRVHQTPEYLEVKQSINCGLSRLVQEESTHSPCRHIELQPKDIQLIAILQEMVSSPMTSPANADCEPETSSSCTRQIDVKSAQPLT